MAGADTVGTVSWLHRWQHRRNARPGRLYTVAEVGNACGLPGPVIMQLVPRTWTDEGWMYTGEQLQAAIKIAAELRRERPGTPPAGPTPV